jgi:predicted transposase/invertase (TIGR01784 family)
MNSNNQHPPVSSNGNTFVDIDAVASALSSTNPELGSNHALLSSILVPNMPFCDLMNDVAFKKVFGANKELVKSLLNSALELSGRDMIQEVTFLSTELLPGVSVSKKSIVDVLCTDKRGSKRMVAIWNRKEPNHIKRVQEHVTRVYSSQYSIGGGYHLTPVTLLSISKDNVFDDPKDKTSYFSRHEIVDEETYEHVLKGMSWAFIELGKFAKGEGGLETTLDFWIHTIKQACDMMNVPDNAPKEVKDAYGILEKANWSQDELVAYVQAEVAHRAKEEALRAAEGK